MSKYMSIEESKELMRSIVSKDHKAVADEDYYHYRKHSTIPWGANICMVSHSILILLGYSDIEIIYIDDKESHKFFIKNRFFCDKEYKSLYLQVADVVNRAYAEKEREDSIKRDIAKNKMLASFELEEVCD